MPSRCAAAASCAAAGPPGRVVRPDQVGSRPELAPSVQLSVRARAVVSVGCRCWLLGRPRMSGVAPIGAAQRGDAVSSGAPGRIGSAADDGGYLGVGQARPGSGRRPPVCLAGSRWRASVRSSSRLGSRPAAGDPVTGGADSGGCADRDRPAGDGADDVDRLAVRDGHQPGLDVGVGRQVRVGPHRGQERLRPGVVGVGRPEDGPAYPQHGRAVPGDHRVERRLGCHALQTCRARLS